MHEGQLPIPMSSVRALPLTLRFAVAINSFIAVPERNLMAIDPIIASNVLASRDGSARSKTSLLIMLHRPASVAANQNLAGQPLGNLAGV